MWIFSKMRGTEGKCVGPASASSATICLGSPRQKTIVPPTDSATIWVTRASTWASGRKR